MTVSTNKKQELKKYIVFAGMGLLFAGAMALIFLAPSSKKKEEQKQGMGLNTDVPAPARNEIVQDKQTAYEQDHAQQMKQERMKTLDDFTAMVDVGGNQPKDDDLNLLEDNPGKKATVAKSSHTGRKPSPPAQNSVNAYKDMNRTLGAFYEQPKEDGQVKQLKEEVEALKNQLENQPKGTSVEEQMALMEKSYQMASRYLPQGQAQPGHVVESPSNKNPSDKEVKKPAGGKTTVTPVSGVQKQVVSALSQPMSDAEFVEAFSRERNLGFHSLEAESTAPDKNTIRACIHDDQTVSDGMETQRNVRIRLTEPMSVGGTVIPAHTILTGQARIGERLEVVISSIEYLGRIYATEIVIYDVDGQRGIAIPPSLEVNAAKEVAANAGSNMGTSFTFSQSAGQQIAADLGRGVIQGTSQYIAKKMRVVKVHLKAGYQVFLSPSNLPKGEAF